jgi:hypothetical protein
MADVSITIGAKDEASKVIKGVGDTVDQTTGRIGKMGSALGDVAKIAGGFVLAQGILKAPGFFMDAAKAAAEDEAATARLQQTIKSLGGDYDAQLKKVNEAITSGQKLAFTDDEVRDSFQFLAQATGSSAEALKRQSAAMDLSRGANIPLAQATKMLGKINEENVDTFKKLGIEMADNATEADALAAVQAKFGGQADAYAKSTAGQFAQAKIAMSEIVESIGGAVLPAFTSLATFAADKLPILQEAVGDLAEKAKALAEAGWEKIEGPLKAIAEMTWDALKDAASVLVTLGAITWDGLVAGFTAIKDFASAEIAPRIADIASSIKEIAQASIAHVAPQFDALKSAIAGVSLKDLSDGFQTLKEKIQPAIDVLQPLVERVLAAAKQAVMDVVKELGPLKKAFEDLGKALEPLTPLLEPLAKVLGTVLVLAVAALLLALEGFIRFTGTTLKVAIEALVIVIKGITLAIEGVTKVVQEWGPKIGGALGDVAKTFKANIDFIIGYFDPLMNIGEGVINGIVNGIQAGTQKVMDAARAMVGAIEGAIPDWIPHSPSKRGVEIGKGFGDGVVKGISDSRPILKQATIDTMRVMDDEWKVLAQGFLRSTEEDIQLWAAVLEESLATGREMGTAELAAMFDHFDIILANAGLSDEMQRIARGAFFALEEGFLNGGGVAAAALQEAFDKIKAIMAANAPSMVVPGAGGAASSYILGSDGKWYPNEAAMPPGVSGASSGGDPNAKTANGSSTSYIGGGQTAGLPHMPNVGDTFNGMTWNGTAWVQGPSADTGTGGAQHATITIVQNIGSVGSKGEAAMMMQDGAYALATRGL